MEAAALAVRRGERERGGASAAAAGAAAAARVRQRRRECRQRRQQWRERRDRWWRRASAGTGGGGGASAGRGGAPAEPAARARAQAAGQGGAARAAGRPVAAGVAHRHGRRRRGRHRHDDGLRRRFVQHDLDPGARSRDRRAHVARHRRRWQQPDLPRVGRRAAVPLRRQRRAGAHHRVQHRRERRADPPRRRLDRRDGLHGRRSRTSRCTRPDPGCSPRTSTAATSPCRRSRPTGAAAAPVDIERPAAEAHQIVSDASGRHVFVPCRSGNVIAQYGFDSASGQLAAANPPTVQAATGAGPRHIAFHPNQQYAYVINELNGTITSYRYDATAGLLSAAAMSAVPGGHERDLVRARRRAPVREIRLRIEPHDQHHRDVQRRPDDRAPDEHRARDRRRHGPHAARLRRSSRAVGSCSSPTRGRTPCWCSASTQTAGTLTRVGDPVTVPSGPQFVGALSSP